MRHHNQLILVKTIFKSADSLKWFRCWLAMPLVADFLRWVLVCRTLERKELIIVCLLYIRDELYHSQGNLCGA